MTKQKIEVSIACCYGTEGYGARFDGFMGEVHVKSTSRRQAAIKASAVSKIPNAEFYYLGEKVFESGPASVFAGVDLCSSKPCAFVFFGTDPTSQAIADAANTAFRGKAVKKPSLRPVVCRHWQSDCKTQVRFEDSQSGLCVNDKLGICGYVCKDSTTKYISDIYYNRLHRAGYTIDSFVEGHPVKAPEPSLQQLQGELAAVKRQLNSALSRVENEKAKREAQRLEYAAFRNKAFEENHYWAGLSKCVSEFLLWTEQKSIVDVGDQLFPAIRSAYEKLEKDLAAERKRSDVLETQVRDLQAEKTRYVAAVPVQTGQAVYACDSRGHQEIEKLTKANLELRKELGEMVDKYSELWGRVSRIKGLL